MPEPAGPDAAALAHGDLVNKAQTLYLAHLHAQQGTGLYSEKEIEALRAEVRTAAATLAEACDAKPLDADALFGVE